jgi:hypothetical protein
MGRPLQIFLHPGKDEVAGSVENATNALNLVGSKALADRRHDGDAACNGGLECDRPATGPGHGKQFRPMLGQKSLVGGHEILAMLKQFDCHAAGRLQAADQQHAHRNGWIAADSGDVAGDAV